jgi:hypothetical protein
VSIIVESHAMVWFIVQFASEIICRAYNCRLIEIYVFSYIALNDSLEYESICGAIKSFEQTPLNQFDFIDERERVVKTNEKPNEQNNKSILEN